MIATMILATAVTVKGLVAVTGQQFKYKVAGRATDCSLVAPIKAKPTAIQKIPDGLSVGLDSTVSGTVKASEGLYTFGMECKEQSYDVTIQVNEK
jgi:hypothetical protein